MSDGAEVGDGHGAGRASNAPSSLGALSLRYVPVLLVLVPVVIVVVGGWSDRWVAEDAFIDFRVVHNVLAGHGPVFNAGERVEVYTDPLWVALLSLFYGVFRFIPLEWWSVVLGLGFTAAGFAFGGWAALRLGGRHGARVVIPAGMLCVSVVAGTWEFATSGLETGLIFGWMGFAWWMVVRARESRGRITSAAFVAGIGVTIRPDMFLISLAFAAALACVVASKGRGETGSVWRKFVRPTLAFVALPIASELFRIAYFGLLVSNTSLTKSAFSPWWSQGFKYLVDFEQTYWLWIPMAILLWVTTVRSRRWWNQGYRLDCIVLAAPLVGGILDALYVISIGGDFMHARMLLPGFFGISLALWINPTNVGERRLPLAAVLCWALVCLVGLRYTVPLFGTSSVIHDERSFWIFVSHNPHPITLSDYASSPDYRYGLELRGLAQTATRSGHKGIFLGGDRSPAVSDPRVPAEIVAPVDNIGITGLAAGPNVYIFDQLSLANPVSSHFIVTMRTRPGHEKYAPLAWMIGRFADRSGTLPPYAVYFDVLLADGAGVKVNPATETQGTSSVRRALGCQPLSGYLHSISSSLNAGQVVANFAHAFTWTTMRYSSNPVQASAKLCHGAG